MNLQDFYLGCFGVGLAVSLISFLSGALHLHFPLQGHVHTVHFGGSHSGAGVRGQIHHGAARFPLFNSASLMIFLAWFGGVGYLLTTRTRIWFLAALAFATGAGIVGAALIAAFMVKILDSPEAALEPMDFQMVGAIGKVSMAIRKGGTGEIIYAQGGTRRSSGARSENGNELRKGAGVVVTRFERGIAYVRLWEEFTQ